MPKLTISRRELALMLAASGTCPASLAATRGTIRAPLIVDLRSIPTGTSRRFECGGMPLSVRHRTTSESRDRKDSRFVSAEWIVLQARCTHLGCDLNERPGSAGGWLCLCHGSEFDAAGRVTRGPATEDLVVPEHALLDANTLSVDCR